LTLLVLTVYAQHDALLQSTQAAEEILLKLRLRLGDKLRRAELRFIEASGRENIQAALSRDTHLASQAALSLALLLRSAVVVAISLGYLAWISLSAFLVTVAFIGVYAFIHIRFIHPSLSAKLSHSLQGETLFLARLRALLAGFQALKLNWRKSNALFEQYAAVAADINASKRGVNEDVANSFTIGYATIYLLLVVLVIVAPVLNDSAALVIFKITATVLFIIAELDPWLTWIPAITRADAALQGLEALEQEIDQAALANASGQPALAPLKTFKRLEYNGFSFTYPRRADAMPFAIGPIKLSLEPGQIVFVTGANGAGKTTLLKLLCGLYAPDSGVLSVDGKAIAPAGYPACRELFAAVFADSPALELMPGAASMDMAQTRPLLEAMGLARRVGCADGRLIAPDLPVSLRKRLSLIAALQEDKPIYLLDDFTADQDLKFREYFYLSLLPELKAQGKILIATTYDEPYFAAADRVLVLRAGQLTPT
jgi:putative ATP-binding cassette transporter